MERASSKKTRDAGSNPALSTEFDGGEFRKYELIHRIDESLVIAKVRVKDLREQDLNARYMPSEMFQQFSKNIKARGALEALPYCCLTPKAIEIISGHHTIRAFIKAKIGEEIYVLLETKPLSRSEIRAKQLAHNSISGLDDPTILKEMYMSIEDAELRLMAFIDETKLELPEPPNIQITSLSTGLDMRNVKIWFLPYQLEDFTNLIELLEGNEEKLFVAPMKHWLAFKEAVNKIMAKEDILSIGTAIARMSEMILNHYGKQNETALKH